jgi:hypothetical protein
MSKIVTIPTDGGNPFVVILGGVKYVYKPGETVEVPDGVALEIEEWERWHEKYYGENVPPFASPIDDITAEVGQTIVVKSVDENGKPTEWEAAFGGARLVIDHTTEEEIFNPTFGYLDFTTDMNGKPLAMKNCLIKICGYMINEQDNDTFIRVGMYAANGSGFFNGWMQKSNALFALFVFVSVDEQGRVAMQSPELNLVNAKVMPSVFDTASNNKLMTAIEKISFFANNYNKVHIAAGARFQVWEVL